MKVTIKPGEITVEAEHARDAVEVLNSLAARVLDIYATKPEALVEHVAEKRREGDHCARSVREMRPVRCLLCHQKFPVRVVLRRFFRRRNSTSKPSGRCKILNRLCSQRLYALPSQAWSNHLRRLRLRLPPMLKRLQPCRAQLLSVQSSTFSWIVASPMPKDCSRLASVLKIRFRILLVW